MSFRTSQSTGQPVKILDEGVVLTSNVGSMNFTGAGVTGTVIGSDVTENIPGNAVPSSIPFGIPITGGSNSRLLVVDSSGTLGEIPTGTTGQIMTSNGSGNLPSFQSSSAAGTVTTVSVVTANGVSGTVANPTSTPAITLVLGAITPTSVAASGNVTGSNLSGTNTGDQTITLTGDVTGSGTGSFATTIKSDVALGGNPTTTTQSSSDNSTRIATTAFVTTGISNAIAGVNPAIAVQAATTSASDTSGFTYTHVAGIGDFFTGSLGSTPVIDGYTFNTLLQRLLVKNDTQGTAGAYNGVYYLSTVASVGVAPVFTRVLDYDTPSDINNTGAIPVVNGTQNSLTSWLLTSSVATVGTDPLTYTKFSPNPTTLVSNTLTSAHLLVGNGSNVATDTAITGDVTISNSGVTAIGSGKVTNGMLAGSIDLTSKVTGVLPTANGGTGIAYFTAAGPSTARTYTFPDASTTVLTTNAAVTVAQGGTGAATLTGILKGNGTSAVTTVTAPTGTIVGTSDTQTLTNKRHQPRVYTATNNASLTPEIDTYDIFHLTAMSAATTINNHSTSTPADGEKMEIRFLDNGTARALSWGTEYAAKAGVALPTTTTISKNLAVLFEWNNNLSLWVLMATGLES